jgi:hypothetical protein
LKKALETCPGPGVQKGEMSEIWGIILTHILQKFFSRTDAPGISSGTITISKE